jgi:aryl-alcohol dehydrogenase-like predicted oxidoreductase
MNFRQFGNTSLNVSEIGFGAWAIGGNAMVGNTAIGWGPADDNASSKAIKAALDAGINFFDTADFYGLGHSEELLGQEIGKMHDILIATKLGHRATNNSIQLDYSKEYILEACNASLRRLKRETIDYYQLHSARLTHFENEDCIAAMEQLKQEGKIKYWGLSLNTFKPEPEARYLMDNHKGNGFQLVFNMINQKALPVIQEAAKKGFGIIARMPLQFGLLTGKMENDKTFPVDDHRHFRLNREIITKANQILDENIWSLCNKYSISKTSLALSFILSVDGVSTVIPGIRTASQAKENTSGIVKLEKQDVDFLTSLFDSDWKEMVQLMEKIG